MVKRFVPVSGMTMIAPVRTNGIIALRPDWRETLILLLVGMFGAAAYMLMPDAVDFANYLLPSVLVAALAYSCYQMAYRNVLVILTPLFVFRVTFATYCGIGAMLPLFATGNARTYIDAFFAFTSTELLKYNLISYGFILGINLSIYLATYFFQLFKAKEQRGLFSIHASGNTILFFGLTFLFGGMTIYFFIILPQQFGLVTGTFPAVLFQMSQMMLVGLFMCLIWAQSQDRRWIAPLVILGLVFSVLGLLTFSKMEMLLPIIMMVAAFIYQQPPSFARIVGSAALIITLLSQSQELVTYGRAVIYYRYGEISAPLDLTGRVEIVSNYLTVDRGVMEIDSRMALLRLSYVNVGTFAINQYDSGMPGESLKDAAAIFVPRILWPEKPVLTDIARDLNFASTGSYASSVATGLGVEFYWDYGWAGLFVGGIGIGFLLYLWSLYAVRVQEVGAWHLFAVVLLGMKVGTRSDGFLVVDVLAPLLLAILGHFALSVIDKIAAVRKKI